jgi:hypothetical protein
MATPLTTAYKSWIDESDCGLDEFRAEVMRDTDLADFPHAVDVRENVLVYSSAAPSDRRALQAELIRALADGPGVVVFEGAFGADVIDRASEAFYRGGPTTGSGTPHRSSRCTPPTSSPTTTPTTRLRSCRRPGSVRVTK